jgi:GT2 family glycosyltransferase
MIARCLQSILRCDPLPEEVLVIDQSATLARAGLPGTNAGGIVSVVECSGTGIARGTNVGLNRATNDCVAVTHDDCTVSEDWVALAFGARRAWPYLTTGRVMAAGPAVPSVKSDATPQDFTGTARWDVLYPNNMVLSRLAALALGGFDERVTLAHAGEDLDFCYRWSTLGHELRYEPRMVVWHHPWRTPKELEKTYEQYALAAGAFFAKHVRAGHPELMWPCLRLVVQGFRSRSRSLFTGARSDPARANVYVPTGFVRGWRDTAVTSSAPRRSSHPSR